MKRIYSWSMSNGRTGEIMSRFEQHAASLNVIKRIRKAQGGTAIAFYPYPVILSRVKSRTATT